MVNAKSWIPPDKIMEYLEERSKSDEYFIRGNLRQGDLIPSMMLQGGTRCCAYLDRINWRESFTSKKGKIPILEMRQEFHDENRPASIITDEKLRLYLSGGKTFALKKVMLPLSLLVEQKTVNCLETAILVQLMAQETGIQSYFILGSEGKGDENKPHAYNVVQYEGKLSLVDVWSDFQHRDARFPVIFPISCIDNDTIYSPSKWTKNEGMEYALGFPF